MPRRGVAAEPDVLRTYMGPLSVGLYADRSPIFMPDGALQDVLNVRIRDGKLTNDRIGWVPFNGIVLDGEVTLCDSFRHQNGSETVFGTRSTLYRFSAGTLSVTTINPLYSTGTAAVAGGTSVVGTGTKWNTPSDPSNATWARAVAAGDWFHWGTAGEDDPLDATNGGWAKILSVASDTSLTLATSVGAHAGGAYTIRKSFSGLADELWQWALFPRKDADGKDYLYLTNGKQFVRWDIAANTTQVLLSVGFVPRNLVVHQRILVACDITDNTSGIRVPGKIRTTAIGDPDNWTTLEAVEEFATDGQERIAVMKPLADYLALYCDQSVRMGAFVGPPVFWAFRTTLPSVGIIGRNAIMDYGDHHEFMSTDTLYAFDGVQNQSIAPHVFRNIMRSIDVSRLWQAITAIDEERGETIWVVPDVGDGDTAPKFAWLEHYLEVLGGGKLVPMTKRDLSAATAIGYHIAEQSSRFSDFPLDPFSAFPSTPFNAREFGGLFPMILFGDAAGAIYQLNQGQNDSVGVPLESYVEFATRPLISDGTFTGLVQRIEPGVEGISGTLKVQLFGQERLGGPRTLLSSINYALDGSGRRFVSPRRECRYATLRFVNTDGSAWFLIAVAANVVVGGER